MFRPYKLIQSFIKHVKYILSIPARLRYVEYSNAVHDIRLTVLEDVSLDSVTIVTTDKPKLPTKRRSKKCG